ncbi:MAG: hypothetical protein AAFN78_18080 [Pseudomonadota bacterium]
MSQIDDIKDLLFGHEKKALDALTRRLDTPESRAADVADVLPQSVRRSHARDTSLADAMAAPVTDSIRLAVRKHPKAIADSLFPIIGPAIRKAIAEALKGLIQSINETLDTRLSPSMRFKAWRAGVPLPEYIVQRSLLYQVEQVFLIHRETGMLIRHASDVPAAKDQDAVSAMFTAIQDFVKDSFAQDGSGALETADMGEYTLWAVHGPAAMLTCLIRGTPPRALRNELAEILENIHRDYSELLLDFAGDTDGTEVLQPDIERCLQMEKVAPEERRGAGVPGAALWLLLAVAAVVIGYLAVTDWNERREMERVRQVLQAQPGIMPFELERDDGVITARGLRDPLAELPLADEVAAGRVRLAFAPFHSLEPAIVERRARAALSPPDDVSLSLEGATLVVSGTPDASFRQRVQTLAPVLAGVEAVEFRQAPPTDDDILRAAREAAGQPDTAQMTVAGGVLTVTGSAPAAWRDSLEDKLANVPGLNGIRTDGLQTLEAVRLRQLADEIASLPLYFSRDNVLVEEQAAVETLANRIQAFIQVALAADLKPAVVLTGYTDGSGESGLNETLRRSRATTARDALVAMGVAERFIAVDAGPPAGGERVVDLALRRVAASVAAVDDAGRDWTDRQQKP